MSIRNAAKALLLHDGKVLLNRNQCTRGGMYYGLSDGDIYYDLPGGGQNQYETIEEAVIRECAEETGYTVTVDRLAAIYEEISMNEMFRSEFACYAHKIYFLFICRLTDQSVKAPFEKDFDMLESEWIDIGKIIEIPLYPGIIRSQWQRIMQSDTVVNLGSERIGWQFSGSDQTECNCAGA